MKIQPTMSNYSARQANSSFGMAKPYTLPPELRLKSEMTLSELKELKGLLDMRLAARSYSSIEKHPDTEAMANLRIIVNKIIDYITPSLSKENCFRK